ncbi:MAG: NnrS family protein [Pseudomonadota bacterium]|nr:NnrS family protein [Pseudomonadota bacterium]
MITRGEQMLALRKRRMAEAPPVLRGGFRPFFLGAALWGVLALSLWLCSLAGVFHLPTALEPVKWHRHEMLFGFVGAAVAGFLLTAIPNWTGRLPIAGKPLLALFVWWLCARAALLTSALVGLPLAATLDVGFFAVLTGVGTREVFAAKKSNFAIVAMALFFTLANAADYAGNVGVIPDVGWQAAIAVIIVLISIIGGRIIPSFTRNWMTIQGERARLPRQPGALDLLVIAATAICLLFWIAFPKNTLTGGMLILAAALQLIRLCRWGGTRTLNDPLVLIMHVGYLWIPVGLLLLGLSLAGFPINSSGGIHALTAGAMTTMILAVMTRATLGHTGRPLTASAGTVVLYICVTLAALIRVGASLGLGPYLAMLEISGVAWATSLVLFLIIYAPMLWHPRVEQEEA